MLVCEDRDIVLNVTLQSRVCMNTWMCFGGWESMFSTGKKNSKT